MTVLWGLVAAWTLGLLLLTAAIVYAEISLYFSQRRHRKRQQARRGYIR